MEQQIEDRRFFLAFRLRGIDKRFLCEVDDDHLRLSDVLSKAHEGEPPHEENPFFIFSTEDGLRVAVNAAHLQLIEFIWDHHPPNERSVASQNPGGSHLHLRARAQGSFPYDRHGHGIH